MESGTERERWIVVGMDFSAGAVRALQCSERLARAMGAHVACVHAYEDAPGTPASHDPSQALQKRIDAVVERTTPTHDLRVDAIVRRGPAWEKLANVATELGAEWIVVGADGERGAADEGILGSVTSRLVSRSPRSVIVVKPWQPCAR